MNYELEKQKDLVAQYLVSQGSLIPLPPKGIILARECKKYRLGKGKVTNKSWHQRVASAYQELLNAGAIDKDGLTGKTMPKKQARSPVSSKRSRSTYADNQKISRLIIISELRKRGYKKISNVAGYIGLARKISEAFGKPLRGSLTKGEAKKVLTFYATKIYGGQDIPQPSPSFRGRKRHEFYDSREWQKLRYEALKKYGRKCMCCGLLAKNGAILHVDHIKPRSKFPELSLDINNLQILCAACNLGKGAWDKTDFRIKKKT